MSNEKTLKLCTDPFIVWNNLAWESGQMALASTQVMFKRLGNFVLDRNLTNDSSSKYTSMGHDKFQASLESAQAVGVNMIRLNRQFVSIALKQMLAVHSTVTAIAQSRSAAETVNLQARLVNETMANSTDVASKLSGSGAALARSAIKPVMKRVKRNAREDKQHWR